MRGFNRGFHTSFASLSLLSLKIFAVYQTLASTIFFFGSPVALLKGSRGQKTPNRKSKSLNNPSFLFISTRQFPKSSESSSVLRSSFPLEIKLPSVYTPIPLHLHPLLDSTDDNYTENHPEMGNLQTISNGVSQVLRTQESSKMAFILDSPWISTLFMKSFYFKENGVKIEEVQDNTEKKRRKYNSLWKRQVKAETEVWEKAVEEYRELEREMCEKKLAPALPYFKKLILGWFGPLRNAIEKEQKAKKSKKEIAAFSPKIHSLPADKMAVIVMHKFMGLLMTGDKDDRCVLVVEAALQIGMAIENEVR